MDAATFDTYRAIQELKQAGLTEEQAVRFVNTLIIAQNDLATKRDLKDLENRLIIMFGAGQIALGAFLASIKFLA